VTSLPKELLGDDPVDSVAHVVAKVREDRARHADATAAAERAEEAAALRSLEERIAAAKAGREPAAGSLLPDPRPQPRHTVRRDKSLIEAIKGYYGQDPTVILDEWGVDSEDYRARVLGQFPDKQIDIDIAVDRGHRGTRSTRCRIISLTMEDFQTRLTFEVDCCNYGIEADVTGQIGTKMLHVSGACPDCGHGYSQTWEVTTDNNGGVTITPVPS